MKVSISPLLVLVLFVACHSNNPTSDATSPNTTDSTQGTATEASKTNTPGTFSKTLEMKGLTFEVNATEVDGETLVTVQPSGLSAGDEYAQYDFSGKVLDAHIVDMDNDSWPEVLIVIRIDGPSKQCSVVPYTVVNGVRLVEMYFPSILNDTYYSNGYKGEDEISLVDKYLIQLFPVYKHGDKNGQPTGGTRQLQYELQVKENGKKEFQVVSVTDQPG
jgi:hypothetical protein